jgi:hypothetical protein
VRKQPRVHVKQNIGGRRRSWAGRQMYGPANAWRKKNKHYFFI